MSNLLPTEDKQSILDELRKRSTINLKSMNVPKKSGLLGDALARVSKTKDAGKIIQDDLNAILKEREVELTDESRDDLVAFISPTVKQLLIKYINGK